MLTKSEKIFQEGFPKRRASPVEGLREFQAAIIALMEDMYQVRLARTGNTIRFHHWLSDPSSRALFGLYGPKGDTTVDPSWRLFLEMLFNTDDNLSLAAAYPIRAQQAVLMSMEMLWRPTNRSLEQALQAVRAELAPEPMSSEFDPILPDFLDSDNFGRFLAGLPPREVRRAAPWSQQPAEHLSVPTPAVCTSRKSAPLPKQSTVQMQSPAQASQPSTKVSAVVIATAIAAPPVASSQPQPLPIAASNTPLAIQPLPPPQAQPPVVAPPQNGAQPNRLPRPELDSARPLGHHIRYP